MARPTFEACDSLVISIAAFAGHLDRDSSVICLLPISLRSGAFTIRVTVQGGSRPFIDLAHIERCRDGTAVQYRVNVISTPQPFGGRRWWFLCPQTGRRAAKLLLPRGGSRFASPSSWGLGYATQRAGALEKISRRAGRVYRSLGGTGNWRDGLPNKPRWMRWPTYSKRALALRALVEKHDVTWASQVFMRFPHLKA